MSAPLDVDAVSAVKSVTVFESGAQIFRDATVTVPKGLSRILFDNLPATLKRDTLQVSLIPAAGQEEALSGIILKGIAVENIEKDNTEVFEKCSDAKKEKMAEKKSLELELKAVQDQMTLNGQSNRFMDDAMMKAIDAGSANSENVEKLIESTMDFIATNLEEKRSLEERITDLKANIQKLSNEIGVHYTKVIQKEVVAVLLDSKVSVEGVTMQVSYLVNEASWTPAYDVRVTNVEGAPPSLVMQYNGSVTQHSSEAWTDATVSLSTAKPTVSGQQPSLSRWTVKLQPRKSRKGGAKTKSSDSSRVELSMPTENDIFFDEDSEGDIDASAGEAALLAVESASVNTSVTSQSFTVAGAQTVSNDSKAHRLTLIQFPLKPEFSYITVPKAAQVAFAQATVENTSDFFLLPGETSIFLNDQYLAKSRIGKVSPGESFTVDIGSDEGVVVTHKLQRKLVTDEGGTFSKAKKKYELQYLVKVTNRKAIVVDIEVRVAVPTSHNSDITVKLVEPELSAEKSKLLWKDDQNILHFKLKLQPHEAASLPIIVKVTAPEGRRLDGLPEFF